MKSRSIMRVLAIVALAVSIVTVVGVLSFAGPCVHDDGSVAGCTATSHALLGLGIVAAISSLVCIIVSSKGVIRAFAAIGIVAGGVLAFAPGTFLPLCMMQTMRCWTIMRPFAMVCGIVVAVLFLVLGIVATRRSAV